MTIIYMHFFAFDKSNQFYRNYLLQVLFKLKVQRNLVVAKHQVI